MSEVALLTARKPHLQALAKQGDRLAAAAIRLHPWSELADRFACFDFLSRRNASTTSARKASLVGANAIAADWTNAAS